MAWSLRAYRTGRLPPRTSHLLGTVRQDMLLAKMERERRREEAAEAGCFDSLAARRSPSLLDTRNARNNARHNYLEHV